MFEPSPSMRSSHEDLPATAGSRTTDRGEHVPEGLRGLVPPATPRRWNTRPGPQVPSSLTRGGSRRSSGGRSCSPRLWRKTLVHTILNNQTYRETWWYGKTHWVTTEDGSLRHLAGCTECGVLLSAHGRSPEIAATRTASATFTASILPAATTADLAGPPQKAWPRRAGGRPVLRSTKDGRSVVSAACWNLCNPGRIQIGRP